MRSSLLRPAVICLFALLAALCLQAAQAGAAPLQLLKPKPAAPVIAPVGTPVTVDPAGGAARGTVIMVHAGGWAGHDTHARDLLVDRPGAIFLQRGWRVVSIDYEEGTAGLQDVLNAAGTELARKTTDGPVCVYGESAGAHLALVAAARLRAIDCVVGLGTPTDMTLYAAEGNLSTDDRVRLAASQASRFFGTTPEVNAPWNPIALAPSIRADIMLVYEADDPIVAPVHSERFRAARETTQTVALEAGDSSFIHGTISDAGRARYASAIGSFADRAVAARDAERRAARTGCAQVDRSITEAGLPRLQGALRCLARKDAEARRAGRGVWQQTSFKLRGEINAARIWAYLRGSKSGRRALVAAAKRRARVSVQIGDRSRIVLRATR